MIFEQVHFPTADCISIESISHNVGKAPLSFNVIQTHTGKGVVLLLAVENCRSLAVSLSGHSDGHSSGLQHQLMAEVGQLSVSGALPCLSRIEGTCISPVHQYRAVAPARSGPCCLWLCWGDSHPAFSLDGVWTLIQILGTLGLSEMQDQDSKGKLPSFSDTQAIKARHLLHARHGIGAYIQSAVLSCVGQLYRKSFNSLGVSLECLPWWGQVPVGKGFSGFLLVIAYRCVEVLSRAPSPGLRDCERAFQGV